MPTLRVLENVQVPMLALNPTPPKRAERALTLLREMGLEHRLRQYPNELSAASGSGWRLPVLWPMSRRFVGRRADR